MKKRAKSGCFDCVREAWLERLFLVSFGIFSAVMETMKQEISWSLWWLWWMIFNSLLCLLIKLSRRCEDSTRISNCWLCITTWTCFHYPWRNLELHKKCWSKQMIHSDNHTHIGGFEYHAANCSHVYAERVEFVLSSLHRPSRHEISKFKMPTPNNHEIVNKAIFTFRAWAETTWNVKWKIICRRSDFRDKL